MKKEKKEKLVFVAPTGERYLIGFLSRCADGFILGTSQIEQGKTSHLTMINKEGVFTSHITSQNTSKNRKYFPPLTVKDFSDRLQLLLKDKIAFQLSEDQKSEEVVYFTRKIKDCFDALTKALLQKETTKNEIIYVVNFKNLFDLLPNLVSEFKADPKSFLGMCTAREMLKNESIVVGVSNSGILIIPIEGELIGIDARAFTNFDFVPSTDKTQPSNPLAEFSQSLGINQYIQQEIIEKNFLEKLLPSEKWQAEVSKLEKKLNES